LKIKAKQETSMEQAASTTKLQTGLMLGLFFNTKNGGDTLQRNVD
jgi:hypothetical protein